MNRCRRQHREVRVELALEHDRPRSPPLPAEHPAEVRAVCRPGGPGRSPRAIARSDDRRRAEERDEPPAEPPTEQHRGGHAERGDHREHAADVGAEERCAVDDDREREQRRSRTTRPARPPMRCATRPARSTRGRRELRVPEVAEPGVAAADRRRVPEHGVELQVRAGERRRRRSARRSRASATISGVTPARSVVGSTRRRRGRDADRDEEHPVRGQAPPRERQQHREVRRRQEEQQRQRRRLGTERAPRRPTRRGQRTAARQPASSERRRREDRRRPARSRRSRNWARSFVSTSQSTRSSKSPPVRPNSNGAAFHVVGPLDAEHVEDRRRDVDDADDPRRAA